MEALFVRREGTYLPQDLARGPWSPEALHGGPVAALLARELERCEPAPGFLTARLTVELSRPVPLEPLAVTARLVRPGRRIQVLEAVLRRAADDFELARARALRIRVATEPIPEIGPVGAAPPFPGPDHARPAVAPVEGYRGFHNAGAELRFVQGRFDEPGPATVWIRLRAAVVDGEEPSALQRSAAAADFGNGVSSVLEFGSYGFINPDLSIYLVRPLDGEWVGLVARMWPGPIGAGLASSELWDRHGPFGQAMQSLLVERRQVQG